MDDQLKRRLMGATIVTALAVIFVPMLFEDKSAGPTGGAPSEVPVLPEPIEQRAIELPKSAADVAPAEDSTGKSTKRASETGYRIVPLEDTPPKPAKPAPAQTPAPQAEFEAPPEEELIGDEDGEAPEEQSPAKASAPKPATAPDKAIPAAGKSAEAPPKKPEKAKSSHVPPSKSVAAKPDSVKPAAKTAAAKSAPVAEPAEGESASPAKPVVPAAPKPAAPAPAKPPSAWVVQAGSFAGEANARALADKLRKQNLPASVHVSHRESGDIYRVTVGPELNRARAEQIQKQIESTVGIKGMILPHR